MKKSKTYEHVKFSVRVLRRAVDKFKALNKSSAFKLSPGTVGYKNENWSFDEIEEFYSRYSQDDVDWVDFSFFAHATDGALFLSLAGGESRVSVFSPTRADIETIFGVFEEAQSEDRQAIERPATEKPRIFIGHGRNNAWQKLKSHLQDKHDLEVIAYETGARAGHTIRDILESMSEDSSLALLVLTGEDKTKDGVRARQNVIHECGLFQGRLGFDRAIMLVESGVELASNFDGIQQLRFKKGRITEVFGDVVATIRREFGPV